MEINDLDSYKKQLFAKQPLKKLRIGILCNWFPYPIRSGSNSRLADLLKHLQHVGHHVHLVVIDQPYWWRKYLARGNVAETSFILSPGKNFVSFLARSTYWFFVDLVWFIFSVDLDAFFVKKRNMLGDASASKADYWNLASPGLSNRINNIAIRHGWQVVIVEYVWLHHLVDALPDNIMRILDSHDVMHLRHLRLTKLGLHSPFPIHEQEEADLLAKFHCVIAIQHSERQLFFRLRDQSGHSYDIITVGISYDEIPCADDCVLTTGDKKHVVLFVGGMNPFNVEGIRGFIRNQWLELHRLNNQWDLHVYGGVCGGIEAQPENGVRLFGVVDTIEPYYRIADIVINPVWSGTGLKIKTIEALAHALPLVTTPSGVEGMPGEINDACMVARDQSDFFNMLSNLMQSVSLRSRLSAAALAYRKSFLCPDNVYSQLDVYLSKIDEHINRPQCVQRSFKMR